MSDALRDVAQIRLDNALALFEEFVRHSAKHADAATLRGLEGRFAERLQIQPSYWSQIKGRSRQIGERLARQFEQLCHKPNGWMDIDHQQPASAPPVAPEAALDDKTPRDDDERFIIGLVLTYYRRHPTKARSRLLDLLGEVLVTPSAPSPAPVVAPPPAKPLAPGVRRPPPPPPPAPEDPQALWLKSLAGAAPLKTKKR